MRIGLGIVDLAAGVVRIWGQHPVELGAIGTRQVPYRPRHPAGPVATAKPAGTAPCTLVRPGRRPLYVRARLGTAGLLGT
jgi:hypothetical protein